jgi:membrane protease YdiL (CAAX protease family)
MTVRGVPSTSPSERRSLSFLAAMGWSVGGALLPSLAVAITDEVRPGMSADLINLTACQLLTYSALILAMVRVYEPDARLRDVTALRRVAVLPTLLAAIAGAALAAPLAAIDTLVQRRFPLTTEEIEQIDKLTIATTWAQRISIFVAFVVVTPLCEALFFQGVIYGGLRRGRVSLLAVLGTTTLFAMWRDPRTMASMVVLGFVLSWLRSRSGSVVPALVASITFYLVPVAPILAGRGDIDHYPLPWVFGGLALGAAATALAGWLFTRNDRSLDARMRDG